jgi:hypothetical protein
MLRTPWDGRDDVCLTIILFSIYFLIFKPLDHLFRHLGQHDRIGLVDWPNFFFKSALNRSLLTNVVPDQEIPVGSN